MSNYNRPACPFCGGNSLAAFVGQPATPSGTQKEYETYIHCLNCKTLFSWLVIGGLESTRDEVVAHAWGNWGRRAENR